ncbi:MAG: hypothetical protein VB078_07700 [Clostridiaceae bacterium]|nr:hypothetical protein [Clostridiaceae bacterium]
MSEKTNGEQERFSIDDIIAEVKADKEGYPPYRPPQEMKEEKTHPQPVDEKPVRLPRTPFHGQRSGEGDAAYDAVPQTVKAPADSVKEDISLKPDKKHITFGHNKEAAYKAHEEISSDTQSSRGRKNHEAIDEHEKAGSIGREAKREEAEPAAEEKAPGRRIILFKSRKAKKEECQEEEGIPQYPVSDDEEYYIEEEPYEEDEEEEELYYDFLNVAFDDPSKAVRRLGQKLVGMSVRLLFVALLFLVSAYFTFGEQLGLPGIPDISVLPAESAQNGILAVCAFLGLALSWEVTTAGIWRIFKLRPTLDSLTVFSSLTSVIHGVLMTLGISGGQPLASVSIMCCFAALAAKRSRAITLRRTYKCMEIAADPMAVKIVGGKKYPAAIKTHNRAYDEIPEIAGRDMTERSSSVFAPIAIVASIALAAAASFGRGDGERFVWSLAVISAVISPCALCMSSVRPWASVGKKLFTSGAAILNYRSAVRISKARRAVIYDGDIFPLGAVNIAGMKVTSNTITMEQVVADAAAVMKDIGGGVGKAFGDFAREQYLVPRKAINVKYFEGGGIAAQVQGDYILMGSSEFLTRMGVLVHEGSDKKEAVFVSVNSYLAAIFTLKYTVQPQPYAAFGLFSKHGVSANMAVKDFGVTERLVENRFSVKKSMLSIPSIEMKEACWDDALGVEEPSCAILTRDSVLAFAEVIAGAKNLCRSVRINLFCAYSCSILGMVTMYFLAAMDKAYLASPANIAIYLLIWYLPIWFTGIFMTNY